MDAFTDIIDKERRHTFTGKNTKWNLAATRAVKRKQEELATKV